MKILSNTTVKILTKHLNLDVISLIDDYCLECSCNPSYDIRCLCYGKEMIKCPMRYTNIAWNMCNDYDWHIDYDEYNNEIGDKIWAYARHYLSHSVLDYQMTWPAIEVWLDKSKLIAEYRDTFEGDFEMNDLLYNAGKDLLFLCGEYTFWLGIGQEQKPRSGHAPRNVFPHSG